MTQVYWEALAILNADPERAGFRGITGVKSRFLYRNIRAYCLARIRGDRAFAWHILKHGV